MKALIITNSFSAEPDLNQASYNIQTLAKALTDRNIEVSLFGMYSTSPSLDNIIAPDIAYIAYTVETEYLPILQRLRDRGTFFVNSPESVVAFRDKQLIHDILIAANIAHPTTITVNSEQECETLNLGWPCVIKCNNKSHGIDVLLCNNLPELKDNYNLLLSKGYGFGDKTIIAQEYVQSGDNDMMIVSYVMGDKVSSMVNVGDPLDSENGFKNNLSLGHQIIPIVSPPELLDFIRQIISVDLLNINVCRLEIFYSPLYGYKICNINIPAGRLAHDAATGYDMSDTLVDYIVRRYAEHESN
jgi:glutathione synthase/RimK-type ligase-like ATP-grasp enzyme